MGYARASVSLQVKMDKVYGSRYVIGSGAFAFMETAKVVLNIGAIAAVGAAIAFPPILLIALAMRITAATMGPGDDPLIYDNDMERSIKFRRDLVAQLKVLGSDKGLEEKILADIAMVDDLLTVYRKNVTAWEAIQLVINPDIRRNRHQRAREEDLEMLLNNDLFVAAAKFNALSRKIT
jgi:hypothetical protein